MNTRTLAFLGLAGALVAVAAASSGGAGPRLVRLKPDRLSFVNVGDPYMLEISDVPEAVLAAADAEGNLPLDSVIVNTVHDMATEAEPYIENGKLVVPVTFMGPSEGPRDIMLVWGAGTPFPLGTFKVQAKASASMGRKLTGRRIGHHHETVPGVV